MAGADVNRLGILPLFTPEEGPNPDLELNWNGDELDYIERTIEGITYRKTFTWAGGYPVAISEWVKQ